MKNSNDDKKVSIVTVALECEGGESYFTPPKEKGSAYPRFITRGFGGASLYWDCPVFGTAVFFDRKVPATWQPGFLCGKREQTV